ncbi:MAG TPA: ABC transporter substrate-binding protein [Stellaceae bacterium]|nr:ABC transporter substrate-binding protein [Stellaceae bacterium]
MPSKAAFADSYAALRDGLKSLGYIADQTLDIDERDADGDVSRLPGLARELLQSNPDVILAQSPSAAVAANSVAPSVPIVCPILTPALIPRLAASYAHPGGSVTGLSQLVDRMFGKLVELTRDAIPGVARIGLLVNPSSPDAGPATQEITSAAQASGIEIVIAEASTIDEVRASLQRLVGAKVQALIVPGNGLFNSVRPLLLELTMASHVPLVFQDRSGIEAGGLASYGVKFDENFRRAAGYIDKILKGASPGDLPIEFPTRFELVINLKTAKALGLTIPPSLIVRADRVIE